MKISLVISHELTGIIQIVPRPTVNELGGGDELGGLEERAATQFRSHG